MGETIELAVDVLNLMKNTRQMFSDIYSVADELVQNAQRSQATELRIRHGDDYVEFTDNGCGCKDFRQLFTQALTGWNQEVRDAESPFGTGFFSVMCVSNLVVVRSGYKQATFDVGKMFDENCLDVITTREMTTHVNGFSVRLKKLREGFSIISLKNRVIRIARHSTVKIYWKRKRLKQMTRGNLYTALRGAHNFTFKLNYPEMEGMIWPKSWGSVTTYYQGREVESLYLNQAGGDIFIEAGAMNPRAPDRKEWIRDDDFHKCKKIINEATRKLYMKIVKTGTDEDIIEHEAGIENNLKVEDYAAYVMEINSKDRALIEAIATSDEGEISGKNVDQIVEEMQSKVEEQAKTDKEAIDKDVREGKEIEPAPIREKPAEYMPVEYESKPEKRTKSGVRQKSSLVDSLKHRDVFYYVPIADVVMLRTKLSMARKHGAFIFIYRNKLQRKVLELMDNAEPLDKIQVLIHIDAEFSNCSPASPGEFRAITLMTSIAKALGHPGTIHLCDAKCYTVKRLNGKEIERKPIAATAFVQGRQVYLDRKYLPIARIMHIDQNAPIGEDDRAFIALIIEELSHELAHALYSTVDDTIKHYEIQLALQRRILMAIFFPDLKECESCSGMGIDIEFTADGQAQRCRDCKGTGKVNENNSGA